MCWCFGQNEDQAAVASVINPYTHTSASFNLLMPVRGFTFALFLIIDLIPRFLNSS